jgi:hypothetical protein
MVINGSLVRAEDLWRRHRPHQLSLWEDSGQSVAPAVALFSPSLTAQGRATSGRVSLLTRRQVEGWGRSVALDDGSAITMTAGDLVLGIDGWTDRVEVGDAVAVPRNIIWPGTQTDLAVAELLAWQIAEGHELPNDASVLITQKNRAVLERLQMLASEIEDRHGIRMNTTPIHERRGRPAYLGIYSRAYQVWLARQGYRWGHTSAAKRLPDFLVAADHAGLRVFLRAFFAAEGSVNTSAGNVEISSASREILDQLSLMLRRFGIWLRIKPKVKAATNSPQPVHRLYWTGYIGGPSLRTFAQHVGFAHDDKQQRLLTVATRTCNTNVEGIPTRDIVDAARAIGLPYREFVPSRGYLTSPGAGRDAARKISEMLLAQSAMTAEKYRAGKRHNARPTTEAVYEQMDAESVASCQQEPKSAELSGSE